MRLLQSIPAGPAHVLIAVASMLAALTACAPSTASPSSAVLTPSSEQLAEPQVQPATPQATLALPATAQQAPAGLNATKPGDCRKLDSALLQIVRSSDPIALAQEQKATLKGDKVLVLLIVSTEDARFLQDFDADIGTQSGAQVQAFVPIDQLCRLADLDAVQAIRLPAQAVLP
jgi:hypothetical protein